IEWPDGPDGRKAHYLSAVKTIILPKDSKNQKLAKDFIAFVVEKDRFSEYIKAANGRWFPAFTDVAADTFWRAGHRGPKGQKDNHVPVATTIFLDRENKVFEHSKHPAFSQVYDENVWGKATAPILVLFAAFVIYPMAFGVWYALDADSYRALFSDPTFRQTVVNTLWYVGFAVNVKLFLALLLSGILDFQFAWIRVLAALFLIPWAVPALPGILSFRWMLNSQWGIFNYLLGKFGFASVPWPARPDTALGAAIVFYIWNNVPSCTFMRRP